MDTKLKTKLIKIVISFIFFLIYSSASQAIDTLYMRKDTEGAVKFARFSLNGNPERKIENATNFLKNILQANEGVEFRLKRKTVDKETRVTTHRYEQHYRGVKVNGHEFLLHSRFGFIEAINGSYLNVNIPTVEASLEEKQALSKALEYVGAERYNWEDADTEEFIKYIFRHCEQF